ncbi:MerR family transcriptional regulator [Micromonospora sp. NBS 11-29]|uniref:MerR family transcriptional regulator n=1 Tax=Micromonospora sp. NBS 11-29 TaxID=1960879 RepID=UPI000B78BA45|nr:MerR family transcriptional regulator [Micromonospora sp. NBS 11-29]
MRIGELSERTGASVRSLRYYEQQGLLTSERRTNGYRDYPPAAVATVDAIRSLLRVGLTTALLKDVLPCTVGERSEAACPQVLGRIAALRDDVQSRARRLAETGTSLTAYLRDNR